MSVRGVGSNGMPLLQVLCMVAFLFKLYTTICMFNHEYLTYLVLFISLAGLLSYS